MKRLFPNFIWLISGLILVFCFLKYFDKEKWVNKREDQKFKKIYATHPILINVPIVVIISAKNNKQTCEKTLLSVINQDYNSFRVIYIDHQSCDGSYEKIENICKKHSNIELIRSNDGTVEELYRSIHRCNRNEIVLNLAGKEFLAHENVLRQLNHYYANPDVWSTVARAVEYPECLSETKPKVRTFYAGLFQRLKLQDFLTDGKFSLDHEIFQSHIEQISGHHFFMTTDTLYLSGAPQSEVNESLKKTYRPLFGVPTDDFISNIEYIDLVVFSCNQPLKLYAFLESQKNNVKNIHKIYVLYRSDNEQYENAYDKVKKDFPEAKFFKHSSKTAKENFAPILIKTVFNNYESSAKYVAFANDHNIVNGFIDMKEAVCKMKKTGAYGFYFNLGNNIQNHPEKKIVIDEKVFAWQFAYSDGEWAYPNSINMTLFKKDDVYSYFKCMKFLDPNILQSLWNEHADLLKVGLYYDESKAITLNLQSMKNESNVTNSKKELLKLFEQNLKIDLSTFKNLKNNTVEVAYKAHLIKR